jgi:hypothetical protein
MLKTRSNPAFYGETKKKTPFPGQTRVSSPLNGQNPRKHLETEAFFCLPTWRISSTRSAKIEVELKKKAPVTDRGFFFLQTST